MRIKLAIVDDHKIIRDGIKLILEQKSKDVDVIWEASTGSEALTISAECKPDIYILDIALPAMNGIELCVKLKKKEPKANIIFLSMHDKRTLVEKAVQAGAKGYVLKENGTEEIITAIHEVLKGNYFFSPKISAYLIGGMLDKNKPSVKARKIMPILTEKEKEIVQLIAEGFTNHEIGERLKRSENTIHVMRNRLMRKLNIHKQADLIRFAFKEDISFL